METFLIILASYVVLGVISMIVVAIKEPLILYAWWIIPIGVLIFPYALYAVYSQDNTGRWI